MLAAMLEGLLVFGSLQPAGDTCLLPTVLPVLLRAARKRCLVRAPPVSAEGGSGKTRLAVWHRRNISSL